jgi:hypothetical protein
MVAEKDTALAPWRRHRTIDALVESVCKDLPLDLKYSEQNQVRKHQAAQAARAAMEPLSDVPEWQMRLAGAAAVKPIVDQFEHEQRCAKLASTLPPELTKEEQADARQQIQQALAPLPADTTVRKLELAREEALAPFRATLAKREHERRYENVLFALPLALPFGLAGSDREQALEEIRAAVVKLPVGAAEAEMRAARDAVLNGIAKKQAEKVRCLRAASGRSDPIFRGC